MSQQGEVKKKNWRLASWDGRGFSMLMLCYLFEVSAEVSYFRKQNA